MPEVPKKKTKEEERDGGAKEIVEHFAMRLQDQIDTTSELVPLTIRCMKRASQGFDSREGTSGLLAAELIIEKTRAISVTFSARCILVNKTNCALTYGTQANQQSIKPRQSEILKLEDGQNKVQLSSPGYKHTVDIDIT